MSIIQKIHDRFTGVLARDCNGRPIRAGDFVFPRSASDTKQSFRFGMEVLGKTPAYSSILGEVEVLGCDGNTGQAFGQQLKKEPPFEGDVGWEELHRQSGWKPSAIDQPIEVPA
ncbi:hypothetical protein [Salinicola sp. CR57]|uniref:hypothetical protein n=1 Tax=Salinicola sp. CR57 TaxID=1949086 RepID=UPI000DA21826|nr:hypothetical protein [Salinicola sp. CR57]